MGFTKKFNEDFFIKDGSLVLSQKYLLENKEKFKKITGSRFAAVINKNKYVSPFKMWCIMTNIFVDIVDDTLMKAGTIIEPKIHKYVCEQLNINFKQYDPFKVKWDVFHENKIFGGIPDGEPVDNLGRLLYPKLPMLEIKTTSIDSFVYKKVKNDMILQKDEKGYPLIKIKGEKRKKWFDNNDQILIPEEYNLQLGLYCYLRNITDGIFAICFLETEDYINPEKCDINEREKRLVSFNVDLEDFSKYVKYAEQWFNQHILTGISPKMTDDDIIWFNNEVN